MRIGNRLNITRQAVYWYTKRRTLSLDWRCKWSLPRFEKFGIRGWWFHLGPLLLENLVFDWDDDWGEQQAEIQAGILEMLLVDSLEEYADELEGDTRSDA